MALEHLLLERVDALVAAAPSSGWASLSDADLMLAVERIGELRQTVDSLGMLAAGEVDRRGEVSPMHVRWGEKSAAHLIAGRAKIEIAEARAWCTAGAAIVDRTSFSGERLMPRREQLADAVQRAGIAVGVAAQVAVALDALDAVADRRAVAEAERFLLDRADLLTTRDTARLGRVILERFDQDGAEPREDRLRARSGLSIQRGDDGLTRWVLTMHPEAAGFLTAALDARTAPRRDRPFSLTTIGSVVSMRPAA